MAIAILIGVIAIISNFVPKKRRKRGAKEATEKKNPKPLESAPLHFEANDIPPAYQLRPSLLTKAERSFYGVLRQVLREEWTVFAKVRVSDIVTVPRGVSGWQTQFNRVQSKHIDFVVCNPSTLRVLAAVELDDSSHRKLERKERDAFVDEVFATAKLPLIHVPARQAYTLDNVRELLLPHLKRSAVMAPLSDEEEAALV